MRYALKTRLREELQSNLHRALWKTFTFGEPAPHRRGPDPIEAMERALTTFEDVLEDTDSDEHFPFIGVGLWNMLHHLSPAGELRRQRTADRAFTLVRTVLGLERDEAVAMRRERTEVFPTFPDLELTDSQWPTFSREGRRWSASLEVTVLKDFEKFPKRPEEWLRDPLWTGRRPDTAFGARPARVTYDLQLSVEEMDADEVTFDVSVERNDFRRTLTFETPPKQRRVPVGGRNARGQLATCRGQVIMEKLEGAPARTKVTQVRTVEFGSKNRGGVSESVERPTIAYWLQADALRLAMA